jgi:type I restriction enzyme S subunit
MTFGAFMMVYRPEPAKVLPSFVAQLFHTKAYREWVEVLLAGSSINNLKPSDLGEFAFRLPSFAEQRSTSVALSDSDGLIGTLEHLITKRQVIMQGIMHELLTARTRLPGFGAPWKEVRLGDHVTYLKTVPLSRAQLDAASPLCYLHYGDIHTSSAIYLDAAVTPMPRASQLLAGNAGRLRIGDLVFADASEDPAGIGKSMEITSVPIEGAVPGLHTIAARFDKSVLADGFKAYLQFIPTFRGSLMRLAAGTKVLATTRSSISSVTLNLPDVDEQQAIAQVLIDCGEEIDALRSRLSKAKDVKQGMMQELLTGRTLPAIAEVAS